MTSDGAEPKPGDRLIMGGVEIPIHGLDEDRGVHLEDGRWVRISRFEKKGDIWVERGKPVRIIPIGEQYGKREIAREGIAVDRPAVFEGGATMRVVTSSPCCVLHTRKLRLDTLLHYLEDGALETCTQCRWNYRVTLLYRGSPRLGVYGVRWESMGS